MAKIPVVAPVVRSAALWRALHNAALLPFIFIGDYSDRAMASTRMAYSGDGRQDPNIAGKRHRVLPGDWTEKRPVLELRPTEPDAGGPISCAFDQSLRRYTQTARNREDH
jgi:hypothetical protein